MQLTVPQRTVADTRSFPVNPNGVSRWLAKLQPMLSASDARDVYRGLKHSNRLHNDVDQRRAVLACFIPVLRELHNLLMDTCRPQPLPLTRDFQRAAQLVDGLLREEAIAFKILLADSDIPAADDIRRALQALARQAQAAIYCGRQIPEALLHDAHQLYALAEQHGLLLQAPSSTALPDARQHYYFILLLTLADCRQQRVRQLPLVLEFLQQHLALLTVSSTPPDGRLTSSTMVVHLEHGARPIAAASLLQTSPPTAAVRWLDLEPLLNAIDIQMTKSRSAQMGLLGADALERQSMARLRLALTRGRGRRSARAVTNLTRQVVFGHKAICADLMFGFQSSAAAPEPPVLTAIDKPATESIKPGRDEMRWTLFNQSLQGVALINQRCRPGLVQTGELISISNPAITHNRLEPGKTETLLGVVRWVSASSQAEITLGVECLARSVLPVEITHSSGDAGVADHALIVVCKVHKAVMQTMLLPAYRYQAGELVVASLNGKSRRLLLKRCLQTNGLFSHFSLADA